MSDGRTFEPLVCIFCKATATTRVSVLEDWGTDWVITCDKHQFTAFS